MEIKKLDKDHINMVVDLWYDVSVTAHSFIPAHYWKKNKSLMADKYLPNSETYIAINNNELTGFISMIDDYLAAIFIKNNMQNKGIGKSLLDYIKTKRQSIQLKVYKKNINSVSFYKKQGFRLESESFEKETGEWENYMVWEK